MAAMVASDVAANTAWPRVGPLDLPNELLRQIICHVEARAVEPTCWPTLSDDTLTADPYFYRLQCNIDEYAEALPLVFSDLWAISRCHHRLCDITSHTLYRAITAHVRGCSDPGLGHARLTKGKAHFIPPARYTIDLIRKADRHLIQSVTYTILVVIDG